jgi:hypothetical protein
MTEEQKKHTMTKEQYLETHLRDMDDAKKRWYINAMENWSSEDYDRYTKIMLWMLGELTEEDLKKVRKLLERSQH